MDSTAPATGDQLQPERLAYNLHEAAAMLGMSTGLLRQLIARGRITYTTAGTRVMVSRAAIDAFLASPPERAIVDPTDYRRASRAQARARRTATA